MSGSACGHQNPEGATFCGECGGALAAGEVIKDQHDFYGRQVILATRVAGKAAGGEILVSALLRQLVESSVGASMFADAREVELKGLSGTHTVYGVGWRNGTG